MIEEFYNTEKGKDFAQHIYGALKTILEDHNKNTPIIGVGYTEPYFSKLRINDRLNCISIMEKSSTKSRNIIISNLDELPLKENSIDTIFVNHITDKIDSISIFLSQMHELLTEDGTLLLAIPVQRNLLRYKLPKILASERSYGLKKIIRILKKSGFDEIKPTRIAFHNPTPKLKLTGLVRANYQIIIARKKTYASLLESIKSIFPRTNPAPMKVALQKSK